MNKKFFMQYLLMDKDKKVLKTKCFFVLNSCCQYLFKILVKKVNLQLPKLSS